MATALLKGVNSALFITALTLAGGMLYSAVGWGELPMSTWLDIGLILSCVAAGFRAGREGGLWLLGGIAALAYVVAGLLAISLFVKVSAWGALQVSVEGGLLGILAGGVGARGAQQDQGKKGTAWRPGYARSQARETESWDSHIKDWSNLDTHDQISQAGSISYGRRKADDDPVSMLEQSQPQDDEWEKSTDGNPKTKKSVREKNWWDD